jgi:Ca2+-binding RTX toxin-like protein
MANIFLTAGNDSLTDNAGTNLVFGGAGHDTLASASYDDADTLDGGAGNDSLRGQSGEGLHGGIGNDTLEGGTLRGGAGDGTYIFNTFHTAGPLENWIFESANGGFDRVKLHAHQPGNFKLPEHVDAASVEQGYSGTHKGVLINGNALANRMTGYIYEDTFYGGDGNDYLDGGDKGDELSGDFGNDTLVGGAGSDVIQGGFDFDRLRGDAGNDLMDGGWHNATLEGGAGADTLTGGYGNDTFVFRSVADSTKDAPDVITDFTPWTERINLSAIDADGAAVTGNGAFRFVGSQPLFGSAGDLWLQVEGGNGLLRGDVDGDGLHDFQVVLQGVTALTSADFIL